MATADQLEAVAKHRGKLTSQNANLRAARECLDQDA
jgi:hypothetical protein